MTVTGTMTLAMGNDVRLPKSILDAVDRRARALRVTRDRWIVRALERQLTEPRDWSPGFFERLADVDAGTRKAVDDLLGAVVRARTSKVAPEL